MIRVQLVDNTGHLRGEIVLRAEEIGTTESDLRLCLAQKMYLLDHGKDTRSSWALHVDHDEG